MTHNTDPQVDNDLLARAEAQIRDAQPDDAVVAAAAERVWARLESEGGTADASFTEPERLETLDDYLALIPAYLDGRLSDARRMLVEDYSRSSVPFRKALNAARRGEPMPEAVPVTASPGPAPRQSVRAGRRHGWALAAAMLLAVAVAALAATQLFLPSGGTAATIAAIDGPLFRVDDTMHLPLEIGDTIKESDRVRTGRDAGAVLELSDGTRVELAERTEMAIDEGRRGTTIRLARGNVIVEAAKQKERRLYVATEDCLVSVTGTIFSVNHGTKGSRVAVIEGEVRVDHSGQETVLTPGEQATTSPLLASVPVDEEVAWSRNIDEYIALLQELDALRAELDRLPVPNLRYDSRLLDLMPPETVIYAALPNLGETIGEAYGVVTTKLDESPLLREWWEENNSGFEEHLDELVAKLTELGQYVGAEIAVGGALDSEGDMGLPVLLAEVENPAGLQTFLDEQIGLLSDGEAWLEWVDNPLEATASADDGDRVYGWLHNGVLVLSPDLVPLQWVAALELQGMANPFVGTDFHGQIAALYDEGAEILVAADLEVLLGTTIDEAEDEVLLDRLGVGAVRHLIAEQKRHDGKTYHRAALTFAETRTGIASWLAEPAPMGALEMISPDATFFAAFVIKDPAQLLDDVYGFIGETDGDDSSNGFFTMLRRFESEQGLSLRDDLAASLGGEIAIALDGPVVPTPAWKVVLEVYDSARLQWTFEQLLAEVNRELAEMGEDPVEIRVEQVAGRTAYVLPSQLGDVCYTYTEGYLLAAPSTALLDRAIRYRDSGYTIADSPRLTGLFPADGRAHFSALVYKDFDALLAPLLERLDSGELDASQQQLVEQLKLQREPSLGYAYGESERIIMAASTKGDIFVSSLMSILGAGAEGSLLSMMDN
ncbi:MAG: FecR family protein [Acidobacteriota bacterium]